MNEKIKISTIVAMIIDLKAMIIDLKAMYVCFSKAVKIHSKDKTPVKKLSERIKTSAWVCSPANPSPLSPGIRKKIAHNKPNDKRVVTA